MNERYKLEVDLSVYSETGVDVPLTELQELHKTLAMVFVLGEEYQGQYDTERDRYRELTGRDWEPSRF